MALSDFNNSNLGNLIALNNSVDELVQEDVAYSDLNKLVDQQVEKDIVGEKLANDVNLQQAGRNKYLHLKDKQKVISAAVDNEIAGLRNITGSESNDILYGGPILNDQQLQPRPLDDELSVRSANQKDFINPPYVKDGSILPIEFGPAAEDSARREGLLKRNNVSAPMNNVGVVPPINAAPINVGVVPPPVAANTDSSDSSAGFNLANTDSSDSSAGFNLLKAVGDISADSMSASNILRKAEAEAEAEARPVSVTVTPDADRGGAVPVATTIQNPLIRNLDKQIRTSLARLNTKADPKSSKPFFDWLGDFSAGLRAAGKSGDQGLGAIATGFEVARKGQQQRTALAAASQTAAIENIEKLGKTIDELGGLGGSNFGGWGSAASQYFKTAGLARSGVVTDEMLKNIGQTPGHGKFHRYTTDKQGNVQIKTSDKDIPKQILGWELDENGNHTGKKKNYVVGSEEYNKAVLDPETKISFNDPEEIESFPTEAEARKILGKNYDLFAGRGAVLSVRKKGGNITGVSIKNAPKGTWISLLDENNNFRMVDSSIPGAVERAKADGFTRNVNISLTGIPRTVEARLRSSTAHSERAIKTIDMLLEENLKRVRAGQAPLFGTTATVKRFFQNLGALSRDIGRQVPGLRSVMEEMNGDYEFNMTEGARDSFDRLAASMPVHKIVLVYSFAKAMKKGQDKINNKDVEIARRALKDNFLQGAETTEAGMIAFKQKFLDIIADNNAEIERSRLKPEGRRTPTPNHIQIMIDNKDNPVYRRSFKRYFGEQALKEAIGN